MSRYINADAFDERVRISVGLVEEELTEDYKDGVRCTLEILKTEPTVDVPQWIPCSERLPEKDTSVLGYIRCASFDYMNVLWRDDYSGDWADGDNFHHEVIAWMPLPKPYEGRTDEQIH